MSAEEDCLNENLDASIKFEIENTMEYLMERSERLSDDILDLLPADPFGMDFINTFTAVSELLDDVDKELATLGFICDGYRELNLIWNDSMQFPQEGREWKINEISMEFHIGFGIPLCDGDPVMGGENIDEALMYYGYEKYRDDLNNECQGFTGDDPNNEFQGFTDDDPNNECQGFTGGVDPNNECQGFTGDDPNNECEGCSINRAGNNYFEDFPPDVLFVILGYLGLRDLLNIQSVCKFFRNTVQNSSLWKCIHIDWPLSSRLTDGNLLRLTSMAQGNLQCLRLVQCIRITIGGLRLVLERNPGLTKLCIPGCIRLNMESILSCLKSFKSSGLSGIKQLSLGNIQMVTQDQFDELNLLLDIDHKKQVAPYKPRYYGAEKLYLSCTDDRRTDIEKCPRCQKFKQVYDCPAESCQGSSAPLCRACVFCISRCISCGECISDSSYQETFCLEFLCLDCLKKFLKCQEEMDGVSSNCTIFHQEGSLHFYLFS